MTGTSVSAVTAYSAHRQWASRPPDERYASVQALYEAARARRLRLEERTTHTVHLETEAVGLDVVLRDTSGRTAALTNWSFGQLASLASAPPSYDPRSRSQDEPRREGAASYGSTDCRLGFIGSGVTETQC